MTKKQKASKKCYKERDRSFQLFGLYSNNSIMRHKMKSIRSEYHQISSYEINKFSLSCYDDKRHLLDDGITSLAYGNCQVKQKIDK